MLKNEEGSGCREATKNPRWFEGGWNFFTFTASSMPPEGAKRSQNIFPIKPVRRAGKKLSLSMVVETSIIMKFHKVFDWQNISCSALFLFSQIHNDGDDGMWRVRE